MRDTYRYAPLRDYAAIGDGRTVALVGRDCSVDWWCVPSLDSASVFGGILDSRCGGSFRLDPNEPYEVTRRYLPGTNVLETILTTASGGVRILDALLLPREAQAQSRALLRRLEGLHGTVRLEWCVDPRAGYGLTEIDLGSSGGVPRARSDEVDLAVLAFDAGDVSVDVGGVSGAVELEVGVLSDIAVVASRAIPAATDGRESLASMLSETVAAWEAWSGECAYDGHWANEVLRSGLALRLLVHEPTGAIAAAATTSLPEVIGGDRNWDYRFAWVRDASSTIQALVSLGSRDIAERFFSWLFDTCSQARPGLDVLYRLDGHRCGSELTLDLDGYLGSRPVRIGNEAALQAQHSIYGDLLNAAWVYARNGLSLSDELRMRLAEVADLVCRLWREPDAGIWEDRSRVRHFTHSKMMCWVALARACDLIGSRDAWTRDMAAIRHFVETQCVDPETGSYVRAADTRELAAAVPLACSYGYSSPADPRYHATVAAVRQSLGVDSSPLLYRYREADGLSGREGAFLACSFWTAESLALTGHVDEAAAMFESLLPLANDVGLYSEQIDPGSEAFLGNLPQGLTHLALINAAAAISGRL